jgi:hypothetical protein
MGCNGLARLVQRHGGGVLPEAWAEIGDQPVRGSAVGIDMQAALAAAVNGRADARTRSAAGSRTRSISSACAPTVPRRRTTARQGEWPTALHPVPRRRLSTVECRHERGRNLHDIATGWVTAKLRMSSQVCRWRRAATNDAGVISVRRDQRGASSLRRHGLPVASRESGAAELRADQRVIGRECAAVLHEDPGFAGAPRAGPDNVAALEALADMAALRKKGSDRGTRHRPIRAPVVEGRHQRPLGHHRQFGEFQRTIVQMRPGLGRTASGNARIAPARRSARSRPQRWRPRQASAPTVTVRRPPRCATARRPAATDPVVPVQIR